MVITKRLRLRKFKEDDLEELYDYRNNDSCNKYQRYDDTSKEYLNNFIKVNKSSEFLLEEEQHFAIALRTGELIGDLSIYFNNNTITIGYTISYKYQRNGYAFEILSNLIEVIHERYKNYEIVAMTDKENEASINLLKKLGFVNEGYEERVALLEHLKVDRRKEVAQKLKEAREQGDLSENAEYDAAKDEQRDIETQIAELEEILKNAEVVQDNNTDKDAIKMESVVKLHDVEYDEDIEYVIVGSSEADSLNNKISNESPLGAAMLGKKVGDTVKVEAPAGVIEYKIISVQND